MSLFLASVGFGLVTAAVLAIAAVGFTMQFAVTDVLNLAYGAVMIASAFVAYALNQAEAERREEQAHGPPVTTPRAAGPR